MILILKYFFQMKQIKTAPVRQYRDGGGSPKRYLIPQKYYIIFGAAAQPEHLCGRYFCTHFHIF